MLPKNSAIICDDLDEFNLIELQIHQGVINEHGVDAEGCWAHPIVHPEFFKCAVPIKNRVLKYLTDEQIERIETLDESWFPETEEEF